MAGNWMMQASFSGTWKDNQNVAVLPEDNPNADFNQSDNTLEWISKISGSYRFPYGIQASGSSSAQRRAVGAHGAVLGRHDHPDPGRERGAHRHADPTRRSITSTSALEKAFRVCSSHELAVRFNVYNVLNSNMTLTANTRSGATFARPLTILAPRLAEISASYKF